MWFAAHNISMMCHIIENLGSFGLKRIVTSVHFNIMHWIEYNMVCPQYTPQQRAFLMSEYRRTNSVSAVLQGFCWEYSNIRCPTRVTVYKNVRKYQATGMSRNLNKKRSGRPITGWSAANIQCCIFHDDFHLTCVQTW